MSTIENGAMHRVMTRGARFTTRRPWLVVIVWLLLMVTVAALVVSFGRPTDEDATLPGSSSQHGRDVLDQHFPGSANAAGQVIFQGATSAELSGAVTRIKSAAHVATVGQPVVSTDGKTGYVDVTLDVDSQSVTKAITADVMDAAAAPGLTVLPGGALARAKADTGHSEVIGIVVALAVLVVAFGGLLAAALPLVTAVFVLVIGIGAIGLAGHLTGIPSVATTLGTMIGLGVGIDYALFLITRYRALLAQGRDTREAIIETVGSSGSAVAFAGGTVIVALCGLAVAGVPILATLGWTAGLVVLVAVASATTLLPALLMLLGTRISVRREKAGKTSQWGRLADRVIRHPWHYALASIVLLLALAIPVTAMTLGQTDPGDDPTSSTQRQGYDALAAAFGPGINGPLTVVAELPSTASGSTTTAALTAQLTAEVAQVKGVAQAQPARVSADGKVASVRVIPTTAPSDPVTLDTVDRLDALTIDGATISVTGQTAIRGQLAARVGDRMPYVIGIVVLLSALLIFVAFRAPVVAIKAAVMNLFSVAAAYGVLTAVFQWGWGVRLIGLDKAVPIEAYVPMMLFALLFGLSMDYEVFLLTAVRESWDRSKDNRSSVRDGLAQTGVVITSAALIMVCVFASFVLSADPVIKMMGLGLAVAIAVDATVIRGLLVPATMALLGNVNWWTPAFKKTEPQLVAAGAGE